MSRERNVFIISFFFLCVATFVWAEEKGVSGKQLFLMMMSSKSRYESIDAVFECRGFRYSSEDKENAEVEYKQTVVYQRFRNHIFCQQITSDYSADSTRPRSVKEVFLINPNEAKYFRQDPLDSQWIVGEIVQGYDVGRLSYTPDRILWPDKFGFEEYDWDVVTPVFIESKNTGVYYIEASSGKSPNSVRFRYTVDPRKGYLSISRDYLFPDGKIFVHEKCDSFQNINGLWMPFHFTWFDPSAKFGGEYKILSMKINEIKSPQELHFCFPLGTAVEDKIRGIRYKVGRDDTTARDVNSAVETADADQIAVKLPPPATDTQLADTALKAQELMAEEQKRASGTAPLVVPIDIVPAYVWVLPGKNEYVLSISAGGPKPSLVKHTFDPDGLVMQGLEDKIASDGKIRVSLERPAEQKAFANGVLTLDFADQTKTVHFVAAPVIIE
jgi:hypothetical protein